MQVTGSSFSRKGSYTTSEHGEVGLPEALFLDMFVGSVSSSWLSSLEQVHGTLLVQQAPQCLAQCWALKQLSLPAM